MPEDGRLRVAFERLGFSGEQRDRVEMFCARVREANEMLSLVSVGDSTRLECVHIPDSLSLVPWVVRCAGEDGEALDIGSGGGFPALPIGIALPSVQMSLVERSTKKAAFLVRMVEELGLVGVRVVNGEFPFAAGGVTPEVITARAV